MDQIYDEYDDVGVIAIQKVPLDSVKRDINFGPIKEHPVGRIISREYRDHRLVWAIHGACLDIFTRAIRSCVLFLSDEMTARQRHIALRCLSGIVSVMTIVLLAFFLARQSPGDSNERWLILPITALLSFSTNTILYSMHASPYKLLWVCVIGRIGGRRQGIGRTRTILLRLSCALCSLSVQLCWWFWCWYHSSASPYLCQQPMIAATPLPTSAMRQSHFLVDGFWLGCHCW